MTKIIMCNNDCDYHHHSPLCYEGQDCSNETICHGRIITPPGEYMTEILTCNKCYSAVISPPARAGEKCKCGGRFSKQSSLNTIEKSEEEEIAEALDKLQNIFLMSKDGDNASGIKEMSRTISLLLNLEKMGIIEIK